MNQVIAWVTFAGAWLLVAGPLYQGSVERDELDVDREENRRDQGVSGPGDAGPAVGMVVAGAAGHVHAALPLDRSVPAGHVRTATPRPGASS